MPSFEGCKAFSAIRLGNRRAMESTMSMAPAEGGHVVPIGGSPASDEIESTLL
jgi:hypothetical protein